MTTSASGTELRASIDVDAPPATVWALVTDVRLMARWSPQVVKTIVLGGPVRQGSRFVNINHHGRKHWPTTAKVVRFAPHRDFAFAVLENNTVWSFELQPVGDGGTRLIQRRETPRGISALSRALTKLAFGGQEPFTEELRVGMQQTLERIKAAAEAR